MDADGARLRAIGELVQEFGQRGIAVLLDQLGDVVAAAWLRTDREGWDAEVREGVGVVSHAGCFAGAALSGGPFRRAFGFRSREAADARRCGTYRGLVCLCHKP